MGLKAEHLLKYVVEPTLNALAVARATLNTPVARALVLGTALHESDDLRALHQWGNGPAVGLWQMEPTTMAWLFEWLGAPGREAFGKAFFVAARCDDPALDDAHGNLYLACALARLRYWVVPEALPAFDGESLARYWKTYYNTTAGKGTVEEALDEFDEAVLIVGKTLITAARAA